MVPSFNNRAVVFSRVCGMYSTSNDDADFATTVEQIPSTEMLSPRESLHERGFCMRTRLHFPEASVETTISCASMMPLNIRLCANSPRYRCGAPKGTAGVSPARSHQFFSP